MILRVIEENPGIHFRGIMRKTGLMNGVLSYHLTKLENTSKIVAMRQPRTARFYSSAISRDDFAVIKALRRPTPKELLLAFLHNGTLSFADLVKYSRRSPSTVSFYMAYLVKEGLVTVTITKLKKQYTLADRQRVDRLLEEHGPRLVDKCASNFGDMMTSLRI